MPDVDGFEVLDALSAARDKLSVVVMTGHGDVATAVRSLKAGAEDFVEKPFDEEVILRILSQVFASHIRKNQQLRRQAAAKKLLERLTAREFDVLKGMVSGQPNKLVAYDLGISPRTVEMHRASLMNKLQIKSVAELLRLVFDSGLGGILSAPEDPISRAA